MLKKMYDTVMDEQNNADASMATVRATCEESRAASLSKQAEYKAKVGKFESERAKLSAKIADAQQKLQGEVKAELAAKDQSQKAEVKAEQEEAKATETVEREEKEKAQAQRDPEALALLEIVDGVQSRIERAHI